jgi:hypothetical protein
MASSSVTRFSSSATRAKAARFLAVSSANRHEGTKAVSEGIRFETLLLAALSALSDGPQHLAHQNSGGRVLGEEVGCRCRNDRDAETPEHVVASELHSEVASEPIGRFNDDGLCAVRC